jgi:hydrogenase-4 component E
VETLKLLDAGALALLASTGWIVLTRRLAVGIALVAFQSLTLATIAFIVAQSTGFEHVYLAAGLTLLVKAALATTILSRALHGVRTRVEAGILSRGVSLAAAVGLTLLSYSVIRPLRLPHTLSSPNSLPIALSMVLIGLFLLVTRKKALMTVVGLLTIENGLFLVALSTTYGMPQAVEIGVFADVALSVALMAWFATQMNRLFDTLDTETLRGLKG